jgi:hypothetical protein
MLRRIWWVGIGTGVVATCVAFWLLFFVVSLPLFPNLYPEGVELPTGLAWYVHVLSATLPPLASWLLTFAVGGLVAGVLVSAFSGLNGALSAAVTALGGFAWFVGPAIASTIPWIWEPISNPGEVYTRAEALGELIEVSVVFCAVLPLFVMAGYVGGRVGPLLRSRVNQHRGPT